MTIIHARHALTPDGWVDDLQVSIDGGRITAVTEQADAHIADHRVDLLLPAPVNLHSHTFQRAMAGLTESRGPDPRDSFWTWRTLMYRFLDRLTPEHIDAIAALVYMEMLEAGYAGVVEFHYLHHDVGGHAYADPAETARRIAAAAGRAGIGLTLLPVLYAQGGCDGRELLGGQRRFGCDLDRYAHLHELSTAIIGSGPADHVIGIAPHSLRAVSPAMLGDVLSLAPNGPLHIHVAEQQAEVQEVEAHYGARPVEWLLANAPVDERWCLIHCTQMSAAETSALAATGAVAGLCPITESNLGDGIFNATDYNEAGGRFGVGSDSNIHVALWEELATLDYSQRLRDQSRAALASSTRSTGRVLFDAVVAGGAQAAARDSGSIATGHWADLVAVSTDNEFLCDRRGDVVLDSLVFTGHGHRCISDVWSAGRHLVREGRHIGRDAITGAYRNAMRTLEQTL